MGSSRRRGFAGPSIDVLRDSSTKFSAETILASPQVRRHRRVRWRRAQRTGDNLAGFFVSFGRRASMPDLPRGTVTFLFTDVEGSTALWERDRSAMQVAVERHLDLLRTAIEA